MPPSTPAPPLLLDPLDVRGRRWIRAFWLSIVLGYVAVFALGFERVGLNDHDQHLVFHEIQYWNAELFSLPRQWTPIMCGGISAAGDAQIPVFSLSMLAGYALGPFHGLRVAEILWFVLGFLSAFLYAGLWLRQREPRLLAAALWIGNGYFVCRMGYGHVTFLPFMTLPALLLVLHRVGPWTLAVTGASRQVRRTVATLALGGALALLVDGSPQLIIYMLLWVGVYALALGLAQRSVLPVIVLAGAGLVAAVVGAAFLWPLVDSQAIYSRPWPDTFTNPLALLVFLVAPFRGNVPGLPTPQNGYELSLFVGAVVAFVVVRYGPWALRRMPRELRLPLVSTSVVAVLLGMGSLRALGLPTALSPFDLLRELPGFRSVGPTGRYWGFLALPLSLLGAAGLWRLVAAQTSRHRLALWMIAAIALQLVFQLGTLGPKLLRSRVYEPVPYEGLFQGAGERITYENRDGRRQGEFITPTRGAIDCFDMIDFIRPCMQPGDALVREVRLGPEGGDMTAHVDALFATWSRIRIDLVEAWPPALPVPGDTEIRIVLFQAFHPYWRTAHGHVERHEDGSLVLVTERATLEGGPVTLEFEDRVSTLATTVSSRAWPGLGFLLLLLLPWSGRRRPAAPAA